jgi:alpha-mannosidase
MRCVDWLSRDDFAARKNTNAGPTLFTPDAQLIGRRSFRYAVLPGGGDIFADDVKFESERYRAQPPTHQGVPAGCTPGGASLLRCDEPRVSVSAVKRADDGRALVVRLYNLDNVPVTATLALGFAAAACRKTGLLEGELALARAAATLADGGRAVQVPLAGGEIATVAIEPAP